MSDDKFVRNDVDKKQGSRFPLVHAFMCAFGGVVYTFKSQRNIAIYLVFSLLAVIIGFILSIELTGWIAIVFCIALVFAFECMNTALESLVDLVSPRYSELAKHAKNSAAGAVLVCSLCSLVVAALVYIPALLQHIG